MGDTTPSLLTRIREAEAARIVEIVEAHADMDERGNRVLVDLIIDEIGGGSETRKASLGTDAHLRPIDPDRKL